MFGETEEMRVKMEKESTLPSLPLGLVKATLWSNNKRFVLVGDREARIRATKSLPIDRQTHEITPQVELVCLNV